MRAGVAWIVGKRVYADRVVNKSGMRMQRGAVVEIQRKGKEKEK